MPFARLPSISIGTDICKINRIYRILSGAKGDRFVHRILTQEEIRAAQARNIPKSILTQDYGREKFEKSDSSKLERAAEYIAGRYVSEPIRAFAAKEATIKAYTLRKLTFRDIVITHEHSLTASQENEEPSAHFKDEPEASSPGSLPQKESYQPGPLIAIINNGGPYRKFGRVSISHDGDYAVATCLVDLSESGENVDTEAVL
ncbi:hypothetical protein GGS26DRAFT_596649 [Hypomontagnella submonticulosa]|nr:hypothetical protein GGS26DRAFT_596649 [Hypomontagnella submonticulosa]